MPATYEPIATTTLGSAAASITLNSIPGTYTDLRIVLTAKASADFNYTQVTFNSDTATNYSVTDLIGPGASATSSRSTSIPYLFTAAAWVPSAVPAMYTFDIFKYAGAVYKTVLITASQDRNGAGHVTRNVGLWRSTSPITSLALTIGAGTYAAGTTATLYGIRAA